MLPTGEFSNVLNESSPLLDFIQWLLKTILAIILSHLYTFESHGSYIKDKMKFVKICVCFC